MSYFRNDKKNIMQIILHCIKVGQMNYVSLFRLVWSTVTSFWLSVNAVEVLGIFLCIGCGIFSLSYSDREYWWELSPVFTTVLTRCISLMRSWQGHKEVGPYPLVCIYCPWRWMDGTGQITVRNFTFSIMFNWNQLLHAICLFFFGFFFAILKDRVSSRAVIKGLTSLNYTRFETNEVPSSGTTRPSSN